jgi:hypothetical protein
MDEASVSLTLPCIGCWRAPGDPLSIPKATGGVSAFFSSPLRIIKGFPLSCVSRQNPARKPQTMIHPKTVQFLDQLNDLVPQEVQYPYKFSDLVMVKVFAFQIIEKIDSFKSLSWPYGGTYGPGPLKNTSRTILKSLLNWG